MPDPRSAAEVAAEAYYDNRDADRFYEAVWGGEDIHIGLYGRNAGAIDIATACYKMTAAMANRLPLLTSGTTVLDLGAGYGGAARYLVRRFDCKVRCLNISEVQNERNRRRNRGLGLQDRIDVVHGSFQRIPLDDATVDLIWSQGAFYHSADRAEVIAEIQRVLKPGGQVLFTDQMQAEDCPPGALESFYERFKVPALASPLWYRRVFASRGLRQEEWCDLSPELLHHYTTVRSTLRQRYEKLSRDISTSYMDRMLINLNNWVSAGQAGYLRWGIFHFRKPSLPERAN